MAAIGKDEASGMSDHLDHHAALVQTMVLVSAAEGQMTDRELYVMTQMVGYLPVFEDFDASRIGDLGEECAALLNREDGLDVALKRIALSLSPALRETAYALACDIAVADRQLVDAEIRMLELIRDRLAIDRLVAAAIERGAAARHRRL